jgi:hypothetical protein
MALPVICPECGIHNPPENRWCECGCDLDSIRQNTPPPIKKHFVKPSLDLSDDAKVVPEDAHEESATPKPEVFRKSYIRRHWRGELPLWQSYWVNTVLLSVLSALPLYGLKGDSFDAWITESPKVVGVSMIAFWVFVYVIWGWQAVGLWRSARSHIANARKSFWARAAQIMVVVGCLINVGLRGSQWVFFCTPR